MASSSYLFPFIVFLGLCVTGLEAVLCRFKNDDGLFYSYEIHYCPYGCCGTYFNQHCCGTSAGLIAGTVVGGIVFVIFIVALVICCRRRRLNSRLMTTTAPPPQVVYQTSTMMGGYPTTTIQYPVGAYGQPPSYDMATGTPVTHDNYGYKY